MAAIFLDVRHNTALIKIGISRTTSFLLVRNCNCVCIFIVSLVENSLFVKQSVQFAGKCRYLLEVHYIFKMAASIGLL